MLCAALKTSRHATGASRTPTLVLWVSEWGALSSGFVLGTVGTSGHLPLSLLLGCECRCH